MSKKIRVGILFGGRSAEHEVSLLSAKNIIGALDRNKYEVVLIGIDKTGRWHLQNQSAYLLDETNPKLIKLNKAIDGLAVVPGNEQSALLTLETHKGLGQLDVVFPVLHGTFGEDGTVQGLLKLLDIPFVGAGILGSSVGMDKDVMKRLLRDGGLPIGKFEVLYRHKKKEISFSDVESKLGLPMFIKPANAGSSVGVSKVKSRSDFETAVSLAFEFDTKIIAEEFIKGREIECSVLGNEEPIASIPGEIIPNHEFYSYEAKYIDENGAGQDIPAKLPLEVTKRVQDLAIKSFQVLCCEGMGRVDFFLTEKNEVFVNEINTIPGFTKISMYPKLWQASNLSYADLIDRLIELAIQRHAEEKRSKTSYSN